MEAATLDRPAVKPNTAAKNSLSWELQEITRLDLACDLWVCNFETYNVGINCKTCLQKANSATGSPV